MKIENRVISYDKYDTFFFFVKLLLFILYITHCWCLFTAIELQGSNQLIGRIEQFTAGSHTHDSTFTNVTNEQAERKRGLVTLRKSNEYTEYMDGKLWKIK